MRPFNRNPGGGGRGGSSGGGPLLTEHLRDLDLELELLKRKREMIEKQQSLLNQQQAFNQQSYNYGQPNSYRDQQYGSEAQFSNSNHFGSNRGYPSANRGGSSSDRDFSHLYDEPQQSRDRFNRNSDRKRLGDYAWPEPPPKRPFASPKKVAGAGPKQSKYEPPVKRPDLGQFNTKPRQRSRPRRRPKPNDFNPTKVNKPKAAAANKPVPNVPKNAAAALKGEAGDQVLRADRAPSQQMAGRLELALGNILKCIKDKYGKDPEYAHYFVENKSSREMKQAIRDRVREVMMGKVVGPVTAMMSVYRAAYPVDTDKDILQVCKRKYVGKPKTFSMATDIVSPYAFFKKNYIRLMSVSLNKMFDKLEKLYKEESEQLLKAESEEKDKDKSETNDDTVKEANTTANDAEKLDTSEDVVIVVDTKGDVIDLDDEKPSEQMEKSKTSEVAEDEKALIAEIKMKYEDMLNEVVPKKIAQWLPRIKSQILKVLAADISFERAKQAIVKETNERTKIVKEALADDGQEKNKLVEALYSKKPNKFEFHAKIQGRPMMPKKSLMTEFFKPFNPKAIKKLKNVRNLLYVGFDNKEDFDRLIAADGSYVGTDRIVIKPTQWVQNSFSISSTDATSTPNTSNLADGDVTMKTIPDDNDPLNDTLNNQIDELLTSIRNEEEAARTTGSKDANDEKLDDGNDGASAPVVAVEAADDANDCELIENAKVNEIENNANDCVLIEDAKENEIENSDCVLIEDAKENEIENNKNDMENNENDAEKNENDMENNENGAENNDNDTENNVNATESNENVSENNANEADDGEGILEDIKDPVDEEGKDRVEELKANASGRATPTRASSRLANATSTPGSVRTRRASRLAAQNNV